jgi:hypothetical protein
MRTNDYSNRTQRRSGSRPAQYSGGYSGYQGRRAYDSDIYENEIGARDEYYGQNRDRDYRDEDSGFERDERRRGPNFLERAGSKIREKWNDWTDRDDEREEDYGYANSYSSRDRMDDDDRDEREYREDNVRGNYGSDYYDRSSRGRNWFRRAGNRIADAWDDVTERGERNFDADYRYGYPDNYGSDKYNSQGNYRGSQNAWNEADERDYAYNNRVSGNDNRGRRRGDNLFRRAGEEIRHAWENREGSYPESSRRGRRRYNSTNVW